MVPCVDQQDSLLSLRSSTLTGYPRTYIFVVVLSHIVSGTMINIDISLFYMVSDKEIPNLFKNGDILRNTLPLTFIMMSLMLYYWNNIGVEVSHCALMKRSSKIISSNMPSTLANSASIDICIVIFYFLDGYITNPYPSAIHPFLWIL